MAAGNIRSIILAGGGGTRFWPASRAGTPKQCLRLFGGRTLLEATLARAAMLSGEPATIVVTDALAAAMGPAAGKYAHQLLREPMAKNTAAACALAVRQCIDAGTPAQQVIAIFPADHFVGDEAKFCSDVRKAAAIAASSGDIVVFGIRPTMPNTGYGYAETGERRADGALSVRRFHEKPDAATAERYLATGSFFWNAGIFVATVESFAREFSTHAPELWAAAGSKDLAAAYGKIPSTPIDVALIEKTSRRTLLEASFPWSDVGTWSAVAEAMAQEADTSGNLIVGGATTAVAFENAHQCVVHTDSLKAIGVVGLNNIVVAEKDGRLLVAAMAESQQVRVVAEKLEKEVP